MKEKQPLKGIGFGVPSVDILHERALRMIQQDAGYARNPDIRWLYNEYSENFYPVAYGSWLFTMQSLLADCDSDELLTGEVEHWYMGPRPSLGDKGSWLNGPFKVETKLQYCDQDPFNGFYIDEFEHIKLELEKGLATEEELPDLCNRLAWLYIETQPNIRVTLYDDLQESKSKLNDDVLIDGIIYKKREPSTSYHKPVKYTYNDRVYRNHNDQYIEQSLDDVKNLFSNIWANSQILREYGNVIGCGSRLLSGVVELS